MCTPRSARLRLTGTALALVLAAGMIAACQADRDDIHTDRSPPAGNGRPTGDDASHESGPARAENVIVVVGDGMGIAHRELIRLTTVGRDGDLVMNQLQHQGWTQTDPVDPETAVTDSAAAATALATGVRTANRSVAVDLDGDPMTTLLERAEQAGMATGLVTTARVTDATPAAFGAHVGDRGAQSEIARQYLEETRLEVILGGGEDRWYPAGVEGQWPDNPPTDPTEASKGEAGNLVERAQQLGYQYASDAEELAAADGDMLLGLFANEEMFEHDEGLEAVYEPVVPLPVMAAKALEVLSRDEDGFFLLIEEEGIDGMSHRGNARLMIEAGRALDETVALARDFAIEQGSTLLVVVGDHETGGLTIDSTDDADGARAENGPFTVAGTDLLLDVEWATGMHTAAATPASAEGPGAHAMVDVRDNTDIHGLILDAMQLDGR